MALALFDLDNTLLNGDSDHAWGVYLSRVGAVNAQIHEQMQDHFYQEYLSGSLDIRKFLTFQLAPLRQHTVAQLHGWRTNFIDDIIRPMIASGKTNLLEQHRQAGDKLVIITATNDFITRPIADLLGVSTLIATEVETIKGVYTGNIIEPACFQEGKVEKLKKWLSNNDYSLVDSYFYSDSINDLPLLNLVAHPVAVTPDNKLKSHALLHNWQIID